MLNISLNNYTSTRDNMSLPWVCLCFGRIVCHPDYSESYEGISAKFVESANPL